jgi:hypothetical protein
MLRSVGGGQVPLALALHGAALCRSGDAREGLSRLDEALRLNEAGDARWAEVEILRLRARCATLRPATVTPGPFCAARSRRHAARGLDAGAAGYVVDLARLLADMRSPTGRVTTCWPPASPGSPRVTPLAHCKGQADCSKRSAADDDDRTVVGADAADGALDRGVLVACRGRFARPRRRRLPRRRRSGSAPGVK